MRVIDKSQWPVSVLEAFSRRKKKAPSCTVGADGDAPTRAAAKGVSNFIETHGVGEVSLLKLHSTKLLLSNLEDDGDVHDAESLKVIGLKDGKCLKRDVTSDDTGIELVKKCNPFNILGLPEGELHTKVPRFLLLILMIRLVPIGSAEY